MQPPDHLWGNNGVLSSPTEGFVKFCFLFNFKIWWMFNDTAMFLFSETKSFNFHCPYAIKLNFLMKMYGCFSYEYRHVIKCWGGCFLYRCPCVIKCQFQWVIWRDRKHWRFLKQTCWCCAFCLGGYLWQISSTLLCFNLLGGLCRNFLWMRSTNLLVF